MLIGHAEAAAAFIAAATSGRLHHAWLLAGPPGIGKAVFARAAATWLLARAARPGPEVGSATLSVDAAHPTARLIEAGSHLDFRLLTRTADDKGKLRTVIRVDEVRALQPVFRGTPALSDWRAVIVDSLDEMNRNAANALLKNLEEPPANTVFLCVSHAPGRLLPTLRSRCRVLRLRPLGDGEAGQVIDALQPDLPAAERAALVRLAAGAPGRALRFAGAGLAELEATLAALAGGSAGAAAGALALAGSVGGKAGEARFAALLELAPAAIAAAARHQSGAALARTLAHYERASDLAAGAVPLSLEPQAVAYELAGLVAGTGGA